MVAEAFGIFFNIRVEGRPLLRASEIPLYTRLSLCSSPNDGKDGGRLWESLKLHCRAHGSTGNTCAVMERFLARPAWLQTPVCAGQGGVLQARDVPEGWMVAALGRSARTAMWVKASVPGGAGCALLVAFQQERGFLTAVTFTSWAAALEPGVCACLFFHCALAVVSSSPLRSMSVACLFITPLGAALEVFSQCWFSSCSLGMSKQLGPHLAA